MVLGELRRFVKKQPQPLDDVQIASVKQDRTRPVTRVGGQGSVALCFISPPNEGVGDQVLVLG